MLRDIYLHGAPGRQFGRRWRLDVATPAEAVRALITLRPKLSKVFRAGLWRVIVGPPHLANSIAVEHINMQAGSQPLHIVPAHPPHGEDATNIGKIIVGTVLIAAAVILTGGLAGPLAGIMVSVGLSMVMGGVAGLLTPHLTQDPSQATDTARPEDRPSFLFTGVSNNIQQGGPVPVVMGTHLVGSVLVAGSINTEDIPV